MNPETCKLLETVTVRVFIAFMYWVTFRGDSSK